MLRRSVEEVAVNLLFLLILLFVALLLTPSHTLALAWRDMTGELIALGDRTGALLSVVLHALGSLGKTLIALIGLV